MLRVYSILHLEPLWLKRSYAPAETCLVVEEDAIVGVEPVVVESRAIQEQDLEQEVEQLEEEALEPGYLEIEEVTVIQEPQPQEEEEQDPTEIVVLVEEDQQQQQQQQQEEEDTSSSSSSLSSSDQDLSTKEPSVHEEKGSTDDKIISSSPPPLTCDLTSIIEENNQVEVNDSSVISSNGSLPEAPSPTSTTSTSPPRRIRRDSKFNERRKSMTNKLKRAFSSNNNTHRNSTQSLGNPGARHGFTPGWFSNPDLNDSSNSNQAALKVFASSSILHHVSFHRLCTTSELTCMEPRRTLGNSLLLSILSIFVLPWNSTPVIPFGNIQSSLIQPTCHSKDKSTP